ncbi:MAG: serine hydrolase [Alphaproteobacteria bacterium]|nr:serine hydrolase [Alphaproteobacteria bacterium]
MKKSFMNGLLVAFALLFGCLAQAQTQMDVPASDAAVTETATQQTEGDRSVAELEAYVDGVVDMGMLDFDYPGVTLSIVKDGKPILIKGYGYADREKKIPVDPYKSGFYIGSITKTMTFTSVMQLAEQGLVDIDADVNTYLTTFQFPESKFGPITLRSLMAHRAGFQEVARGMWVLDPTNIQTMGDWLKDNIPERVFPVGELTAYSNYGAALAGYIVEEVSGEQYQDYVEEHIYKPLGMTHTTARQPLPEGTPGAMSRRLKENLASVYSHTEGYEKKEDHDVIVPVAAGSVTSTASDMARYMLAHLNGGELDGVRIYSPETAAKMHQKLYDDRPVSDYYHAFRTTDIRGYETMGHTGATFTSFSSILMVPELDMGVFVSVNGGSNNVGPYEISERIIIHMIGDRARNQRSPIELSQEELQAYAGSYQTTRRFFKDFVKALTASSLKVSVTDNDTLLIHGSEYVPLGNNKFENRETGMLLMFETNEKGDVDAFYSDYGSLYQRVTGATDVNQLYLALGLLFLFSLFQLVAAWKRRSDPPITNTSVKRISLSLVAAAGLAMGTLVVGAISIVNLVSLGNEAMFVYPSVGVIIFMTGILLLLLLTVALFIGAYPVMRSGEVSIWRKTHYAIYLLVLVYFFLQASNWDMIGYNFW